MQWRCGGSSNGRSGCATICAPQARRTSDIRSVERTSRIGGPFDSAMHTVDVRPISQDEGWHNIQNLVVFLWRLTAFPLAPVTARRLGASGDFRYHFSPLGNSAPLFGRARGPTAASPLASELSVPQAIRPARFFADLEAYASLSGTKPGFTEFYGLFDAFPEFDLAPAPSLMVYVDGNPVPAEDVRCRNLSTWGQPAGSEIGIDVALGRLALGPASAAGRRGVGLLLLRFPPRPSAAALTRGAPG